MMKSYWNFLKEHKTATILYAIVLIIYIAFSVNLVYDNKYTDEVGSSNEFVIERKPIEITVTGEINNPGIYKLNKIHKVSELIEIAGGLSENADTSRLELDRSLTDGEHIVILSTEEMKEILKNAVDINKADSKTFRQFYGIGEKTANKIIEFREKNGPFTDIEQLLDNELINNKVFNEIKDKIKV